MDLDHSFKSYPLAAIEDSETDALISKTTANAVSILIKAGVRFDSADLHGIKDSGADLRGTQFNPADLAEAGLSNVNLNKAWLRWAYLSRAQMTGVQFDEIPFIRAWKFGLLLCLLGGWSATLTEDKDVYINDIITWTQVAHTLVRPL